MLTMTKKAYNKLIAGHLQWSLVGLIVALFVAFVSSDHRLVVYGSPLAPKGSPPAPKGGAVAPDTINGELVWPDPWDRITETERLFY